MLFCNFMIEVLFNGLVIVVGDGACDAAFATTDDEGAIVAFNEIMVIGEKTDHVLATNDGVEI